MRQIALIVTIEDDARDYGGNDLSIGGSVAAHRSYNGCGYADIETEISEALGRLLLPELQKGTWGSNWLPARPEQRI
jgi:hypothetical protein